MNTAKMATARGARRPSRGFTLVEVMVAVAVIVILASIGLYVGIAVRNKARTDQTRTTFATLESAMSAYLANNPVPAAGETAYVAVLNANPETSKIISNLKKSEGAPQKILDGFGNPIYFVPANSVDNPLPTSFFRSNGVDGLSTDAATKKDDLFSTGA